MAEPTRDPAIRGKVIRFAWTEGPTKGTTHEHTFHDDGTVQWRDVKQSGASLSAERPQYSAVKVADDIYLVSYLAPSGYALTVALNFRDHQIAGIASGAKDWYPLRGTLELAGR